MPRPCCECLTRSRRRRAFTLAELTVSMGVLSLILVGVASSILIATKAVPSETSRSKRNADAAALIDLIESELIYATYVSEYTPSAITFIVPDRDGDGWGEKIRYDWSGIAGAPVRRTYNLGTPRVVLASATAFSLSYSTTPKATAYPGGPVEDPTEIQLSALSVGTRYTGVTSSVWTGQYFVPVLAGNVAAYRVSRVQFGHRASGTGSAQYDIKIVGASAAGQPSGTLLETRQASITTVLSLITLDSNWSTITFSADHNVTAGDGVCIYVAKTSGADGILQIQSSDTSGSGLLRTVNGGTSWSVGVASGSNHRIYGYVKVPGPDQTITMNSLTSVTLSVTPAEGDAARLTTPTLNVPTLFVSHWNVDFLSDPTGMDSNGDRLPDWGDDSGTGATTTWTGTWNADTVYGASPVDPINSPAMVEARVRATDVGRATEVLRFRCDESGGAAATLRVSITLGADSLQTLTVADVTGRVIAKLPNLPAALIDLTLIVDPAKDTVYVAANGSTGITRYYASKSFNAGESPVRFGRFDYGVEFASLRVRVPGAAP